MRRWGEAWRERRGGARRLCLPKPRLGKTTEVVKFLCRDVWTAVFGKAVDKLQTNHFGVYVLQDVTHAPLATLSAPGGDTDQRSVRHLLFPCGLIRGVLGAFGADAKVDAKVTASRCAYHVCVRNYTEGDGGAAAPAASAASAQSAPSTAAPAPAEGAPAPPPKEGKSEGGVAPPTPPA